MGNLESRRLRTCVGVLVVASMMLTILPVGFQSNKTSSTHGLPTTSSSRVTTTMSTNQVPVVAPLADKQAWAGTLMQFSASAIDPDGDPLRYTWDFGEGSSLRVGQSVLHIYYVAGSYTFAVYVDDGTGLPAHNVSTSAQAQIALNVNLIAGWNLISVPFTGFKSSTLGLSNGDLVVAWDTASQSYLNIHILGVSPPTSEFAIVPGVGYWVWTAVSKSLHLFGTLPPLPYVYHFTVPPSGGWVLIGPVSLQATVHASNIPGRYIGPGSVTMVVDYDQSLKQFKTWITGLPTLNNFLLQPGKGYVVWVTASGAFTLS